MFCLPLPRPPRLGLRRRQPAGHRGRRRDAGPRGRRPRPAGPPLPGGGHPRPRQGDAASHRDAGPGQGLRPGGRGLQTPQLDRQ